MTITKCKECGAEISTKEGACPKCGAKGGKQPTALRVTTSLLILTAFAFFVYECSSSGGPATENKAEVKNAEFQTLSGCLKGIERDSGRSLEVVTDKPEEVSGLLSNGKGFGCQMKKTGTKGTYFEGWYMAK